MRADWLWFPMLAMMLLPACRVTAEAEPMLDRDAAWVDGLISYRADATIFPEPWRRKPFFAEAEPIAEAEKARGRRAVERALARYPKPLLRETIHRIYLVGGLRFYRRHEFAGTANRRDIYLAVPPPEEGYTTRWLIATFHREYSTLLLNRYRGRVDFESWRAASGEDFAYLGSSSWNSSDESDEDERDERQGGGGGGVRAIEREAISLSPSADESDLKRGFLTQYSKSSIENDFNEYAAWLFLGRPRLWQWAEQYPAVKQKIELTIAFYNELSPSLDRGYFRSLADEHHEPPATRDADHE